ncbi:MAG TPA: hypothetical protein VFL57_07090 [Bryobacteraceae bacterium]|nr:hypothetical protein [Bryobacteraceae bacterium]
MPPPASPGTNQFRCNACGRYFNTQGELSGHEIECRALRQATETGRRSLEKEDRTHHEPNDAETKHDRFKHGTGQPVGGR